MRRSKTSGNSSKEEKGGCFASRRSDETIERNDRKNEFAYKLSCGDRTRNQSTSCPTSILFLLLSFPSSLSLYLFLRLLLFFSFSPNFTEHVIGLGYYMFGRKSPPYLDFSVMNSPDSSNRTISSSASWTSFIVRFTNFPFSVTLKCLFRVSLFSSKLLLFLSGLASLLCT